MTRDTKITLREARKGKMREFLKEHENDPPGDMDRLDAAIRTASTPGTGSATRPASSRDPSDD